MNRSLPRPTRSRRGVTLILAAVMLIVIVGMVAFGVDVGRIALVRTQLQVAADSAAMAAAANLGKSPSEVIAVGQQYAGYHVAGGQAVDLDRADVEFGTWDGERRTFTPTGTMSNAVRVTCRRDQDNGGETPLFFGAIFDRASFSSKAAAVAIANPRDIAFVVDLSGSMNDDTEPCWATQTVDQEFGPQGYPDIGDQLMQQVYEDLGYGAFPGTLQYLGQPWGVRQDQYAYAELTKDGGPLCGSGVPVKYRILSGDSEAVRKVKGYSAIIDYQIARIMPAAAPAPDSATNYRYWEKYLDYVLLSVRIQTPTTTTSTSGSGSSSTTKKKSSSSSSSGSSSPSTPSAPLGRLMPGATAPWYAAWTADPRRGSTRSEESLSPAGQLAVLPGHFEGLLIAEALGQTTQPGTPPADRGTLPPSQDSDRIDRFNNPNTTTFPSASSSLPKQYRNWIGYRTYVQFMMDYGRDLKPDDANYVPLSRHSAYCRLHSESTAGGTFSFPPRSQPMHAARRALIAAMQVVKERNATIGDPNQRDWVSIVTFDRLENGTAIVKQPLSADYDAAMLACTDLQAVGDKGRSTAAEGGLLVAREHIRARNEGGQGRMGTNKVVVLLTDGVPNAYVSDSGTISRYVSDNPNADFYDNGAYWYDAPLMQASAMQREHWSVFPVGIGLGTDYDFMDRMARLGGTANDAGQSRRGSGNPAEYEQRLSEIFREIITNPQVRLVQ